MHNILQEIIKLVYFGFRRKLNYCEKLVGKNLFTYCKHTHTHTHTHIYIYIYIERERERELKNKVIQVMNLLWSRAIEAPIIGNKQGQRWEFYWKLITMNSVVDIIRTGRFIYRWSFCEVWILIQKIRPLFLE